MSEDEDTMSEELEIESEEENKFQLVINNGKYECDTDNEDEWPDEYKSGFIEPSTASNSNSSKDNDPSDKGAKRAKPFNGLQWNVLEARLGSHLQDYIQQYEKKYVDAKSVEQITEGKLPLSFNVVTRNHKTVLGQFWKFVQVYEPKRTLSILDVVSKTRLTAFSRFLTKRYNEPQTISNKLGHLGRVLVWLGEHAHYTPHHKHIQECRTYLRRLIKPFEQAKRENKSEKQNIKKARGRCMTGEEIGKLKEEIENELKKAEKELTELIQNQKVTKKFAFDFQTRLQTLLLLERDIHIRDVIVNIAQNKVSRIGGVKVENSRDEWQTGSHHNGSSFSAATRKAPSLRDSVDMAEIAINVLCTAATNQITAESQNTTEPRDNIATDETTTNHKHNPNRDIQLSPTLYDWFVFFKEKIRPYLCPIISVDYAWIASSTGNVQQSNQMTIAIQALLAQKFPGKKIGPLDLKRSMTEARKSTAKSNSEQSLDEI